jgi:hypothetical protein
MTVGEAKRRGGKPRATDMGGLMFILPDAMSLEFRQRAASARREGGACFACGGPLTCLAELGVTVMRDDPDGGVTTAMACVPCERGPRAFLVEAWSRRESDSGRVPPQVAQRARALADARAEAAMDARLKALAGDWANESNWERYVAEGRRCAAIILEGYVILVIEGSHGWYWYFKPVGKPHYSRDDGYFSTCAEAKAGAFEALSEVIKHQ